MKNLVFYYLLGSYNQSFLFLQFRFPLLPRPCLEAGSRGTPRQLFLAWWLCSPFSVEYGMRQCGQAYSTLRSMFCLTSSHLCWKSSIFACSCPISSFIAYILRNLGAGWPLNYCKTPHKIVWLQSRPPHRCSPGRPVAALEVLLQFPLERT